VYSTLFVFLFQPCNRFFHSKTQRYGYDEGVAGHITARDPEFTDTFWVNPFGLAFSKICVADLIRVDHTGKCVEGSGNCLVNAAAFAIHSKIHEARPDVVAAAHSHSLHGRAWATLGRPLDIITQDSCAFYNDHVLFDDFSGVVVELDEGTRIANALGGKKAAILQNHGLLTVGDSVEAAAWWYITMERCCHVQLMAEAASRGQPLKVINEAAAAQAHSIVGSSFAGWFQFKSLYETIKHEIPDIND
jgi:ribulose-5-phosphate 4-epimerase/fuculose-1-phosphate aldolase